MPFESEAQRRFMYSQHPKLAKEFEAATPDNADLPERKKKMAEGGVVEDEKKKGDIANMEDSPEAFEAAMKGANVDRSTAPVQSYLGKMFGGLMGKDEEKKEPEGMAHGGEVEVEDDEVEMSKKEFVAEHENLIKNLQPAVDEQAKQEKELQEIQNHAHGGVVSDDEKRNAIYKAMGMGKYAVGGVVQPPVGPQLGIPDRGDPNFWENIKNALTKVAAPITKPIELASDVTQAAMPALETAGRHLAPPAVAAVNELTGANFPIPEAPKTPDLGTPTPLSAPVTPPPTPKMPATPVSVPKTETGSVPAAPKIEGLFNQDTSKLTEGVDATDRQAVVQNLAEKQGGLGSIIAQALAGLGDAVSAKGGREQHALKDIFTMQKQQREEALANFDKERQSRLEQLDLKTKMGENAIKELAAQDAYGVDESLNRQIGAPAGTKHKDLPLYMQMASAKAQAAEKDADLRMRAMKQASDDVEAAVKNAGMFSFKPSAEQIKAQGAKLADQYFNRAKGNVLFQPSDGQKAVWIPAKNLGRAQQMDPNGRVIQ